MNRSYPYRITLRLYSGRREVHYYKASNYRDAFDKAHHFAIPLSMSNHDGVQFIDVTKLTKQYCIDNNIIMEEWTA